MARSTAEETPGSEGSESSYYSKLLADAEYAASMLDRASPGWFFSVDPVRIDNGSATRNILCLIVGNGTREVDLDDARRTLGIRPLRPRGIVLNNAVDPRMAVLNRIWTDLVIRRKQAASVPMHPSARSPQVPVRANA